MTNQEQWPHNLSFNLIKQLKKLTSNSSSSLLISSVAAFNFSSSTWNVLKNFKQSHGTTTLYPTFGNNKQQVATGNNRDIYNTLPATGRVKKTRNFLYMCELTKATQECLTNITIRKSINFLSKYVTFITYDAVFTCFNQVP